MGLLEAAGRRIAQLCCLALVVLGVFIGFGKYQDDRTLNLVRNSAQSEEIDVPRASPTHFRLLRVIPSEKYNEYAARPKDWLRRAPPVLFLPGHMGSWTQVINIATWVCRERIATFYTADFHASASALHASILQQQADFGAASASRVLDLLSEAGRKNGDLLLMGHSMGALVAQETFRLLSKERQVRISGLLLLCGPVLGHPLLLGVHSAAALSRMRQGFWESVERRNSLKVANLTVVVVAAGETDALVPSDAAALPPTAPSSLSLLAPALRDVYASFSHVNIMFSRHSLKAFAGLITRGVSGQLRQAAEDLVSPLHSMFHRPMIAGERSSPPGNASVANSSTWMLGPWPAGAHVEFRPFSFLGLRKQLLTNSGGQRLLVSWEDLKVERVHVLPAPTRKMSLFTLVIFQEQRPLARRPETTSLGEDFSERDRIDCTALADVRTASFTAPDTMSNWQVVRPMVVQYPVKMCLFQVTAQSAAADGLTTVVAVRRRAPSDAMDAVDVGYAQWHDDPLEEDVTNAAAVTLFGRPLSALASMFHPAVVSLPAGRPLGSMLRLPFPSTADAWPVDLQLAPQPHDSAKPSPKKAQGKKGGPAPSPPVRAARWLPKAVFVSAHCRSRDAQVFAASDAQDEANEEAAPQSPAWAAESSLRIFTPRFDPVRSHLAASSVSEEDGNGTCKGSPRIFVLSDPGQELTLLASINPWSILGRCFKSYLGHILAAWLSAEIVLRGKPAKTYSGSAAALGVWIVCSMVVLNVFPALPQVHHVHGFLEHVPSSTLLQLLVHLLGVTLAIANGLLIDVLAGIASIRVCCCCCRRGRVPHADRDGSGGGRSFAGLVVVALELAGWLAVAAVHPSICLLLLLVRAAWLQGSVSDGPTTAVSSEVARLLHGFSGLMFVYNLCHTPTLVLTIWMAQGQHREASERRLQGALDRALPHSKHAVTALADALPWRSEPHWQEKALPALGLLLPILSLLLLKLATRKAAGSASQSLSPSGRAAQWVWSGLLGLTSVCLVRYAGSHPQLLWYACQPVLLLHALAAASLLASGSGEQNDKLE